MKRELVLKDANKLYNSIILNGYSLNSFANKIGVSDNTINNVVKDSQSPRPKTAKKIADGLGKKVPDIFLLRSLGNHSKEMNK